MNEDRIHVNPCTLLLDGVKTCCCVCPHCFGTHHCICPACDKHRATVKET